MNNVFKLVYSSLLHAFVTFLIPRRDKPVFYGIVPGTLILVINLILFVPSFFSGTALSFICFFIVSFLMILACCYGAYKMFLEFREGEKLETVAAKTAINSNEFFYYFRNDFIFNVITVLLFSFSLSFLQLFYYTLLLMTGAVSLASYFMFFFLYLVMGSAAGLTAGSIYYLIKREKKRSFFKVSRIWDVNITIILLLCAVFAGIFLVTFTPAFFLGRAGKGGFFLCFLSAALLTFCFHLFCNVFDLYVRASRIFFIKRTKKRLTVLKRIARSVYKRKIYPRIFYLYPAAALPGGFFLFKTAAELLEKFFFIKTSLLIILFQTIIFTLLFSYPYILLIFKKEGRVKQPFLFTSFLFFILLLNSFLIKVNIIFEMPGDSIFSLFESFITPLIYALNRYTYNLHGLFLKASPVTVILLPVLFLTVFYINYVVFYVTKVVESFIDYHIQKSLYRKKSVFLFGDSLSLYPFMFAFCLNGALLFFLKLELPALARLISSVISTLQIGEIFKVELLKSENIGSTIGFMFNLLFIGAVVYCCVRVVSRLFSSLFSHFILVDDELVYLKNTLVHKTVLRIPLAKINYIVFKQNLAERFLDIGTVYIETVDTKGMIKIQGITSIKEKNILIMDKIKIGIQKV